MRDTPRSVQLDNIRQECLHDKGEFECNLKPNPYVDAQQRRIKPKICSIKEFPEQACDHIELSRVVLLRS